MNLQMLPNALGFVFSAFMAVACAMNLFVDVEGFHGWPIRGPFATGFWAVVAALCLLIALAKWQPTSPQDQAIQGDQIHGRQE